MAPVRPLFVALALAACSSPDNDVELPPGSSLGEGEAKNDPESTEARLCARTAACFDILPEIGKQGCTGFMTECVGRLDFHNFEQWNLDAEACLADADDCDCVLKVYTCSPAPVTYDECGSGCVGCYLPDNCPPDVNSNEVCDCVCGGFDPECL